MLNRYAGDIAFHERRAEQERHLANRSSSESVRAIHSTLS